MSDFIEPSSVIIQSTKRPNLVILNTNNRANNNCNFFLRQIQIFCSLFELTNCSWKLSNHLRFLIPCRDTDDTPQHEIETWHRSFRKYPNLAAKKLQRSHAKNRLIITSVPIKCATRWHCCHCGGKHRHFNKAAGVRARARACVELFCTDTHSRIKN